MLNYQRVVRVIWQFQQFVLLHILFFPSLVDKKDNNGWTRPILLAKSCCLLVTNPSIPDIPVAEIQIFDETSLNSKSADEIPRHPISKTLIFPNISNQFPTCFTTHQVGWESDMNERRFSAASTAFFTSAFILSTVFTSTLAIAVTVTTKDYIQKSHLDNHGIG